MKNNVSKLMFNEIKKLNLIQDSPCKGSTYILSDGSFVNLVANGFRTHAAFDDYLVENNICEYEEKLLPIHYLNAIRCNDGSNFLSETVMELPPNPITSEQSKSIIKYINYLLDKGVKTLTLNVNKQLITIDLLFNEPQEISNVITNYYKNGMKVFNSLKMPLEESAVELHDKLNPKIWNNDNTLKTDVRDTLIDIVNKYIESSEVLTQEDVIDVELLGSNASYNYTPYSDLDVHLVVNMESVSCDPALFQIACNAERSSFNKNYDITVKGIDVEMYVEDVKASTASNGIYSLYKEEWLKFPKQLDVPDYDNDNEYLQLLNHWSSLAKETLEHATTSQQVQDYVNTLYNLRRTSIMTDGEFGKGNLVFKEIRNEGLLDKLKQKQYELSSKELSLESLMESNIVTLYRGIDKNLTQFDKGVSWWTTSKEDAYNYGPGGSDNPQDADVLTTQVNLDNYKTLYSYADSIEDCYLNTDVLHAANTSLISKGKDKFIFEDNDTNEFVIIDSNLGNLQSYINKKLKQHGYDFLYTEFPLNNKLVNEVVVFNDNVLQYKSPDWYKRESLVVNKLNRYYNLFESEIPPRNFIELESFSQRFQQLGLEEEFLSYVQQEILKDPTIGDMIPGAGGARKLRIKLENTGKSGGARVIYIDFLSKENIYLIDIYLKGIKNDLTPEEKTDIKNSIKKLV